ncbi:hypothetical protein ABPG77_006395 [Micractinium sp. CCAP 211/92]
MLAEKRCAHEAPATRLVFFFLLEILEYLQRLLAFAPPSAVLAAAAAPLARQAARHTPPPPHILSRPFLCLHYSCLLPCFFWAAPAARRCPQAASPGRQARLTPGRSTAGLPL